MEQTEQKRVRRTCKDYNLAFKLQVIDEIERRELTWCQAQRKYGIQGSCTVLGWLRKYGNLGWSSPKAYDMDSKEKTPEQRIKELETALERERTKNLILSRTIDIIENEYGLPIPKKPFPNQPDAFKKKGK
jgi:transposase-like protein